MSGLGPGTLFEMDIAAALLNIGLGGSQEKTLLYFKTLDKFFSILYILSSLQVTDARDGQSRTIRQFQFTGNTGL